MRGRSPMRVEGRAVENFGKALAHAAHGVRRQLAAREEPAFEDFAVRRRDAGPLPFPHDEQRDVIARQDAEIGEQPMELRPALQNDARFLLKFARQGRLDGLAPLDAAAGKMPSGPVAVAHEQHGVAVDHDALGAKGCAARQPPVGCDDADGKARGHAGFHPLSWASAHPVEFATKSQAWSKVSRYVSSAGAGETGPLREKRMRRAHPLWTLVVCAGVMLAINMGIRQTFGLYLKPISQDLDLDRQVFSLAMAFLNLVWGLAAPFAGALSDRFGALKVALAGAAAYVAGLILMATAPGASQLLAAGALVGLGVAGTGFTAVFGVIARAAPPEKRASALGLATTGSAIGQFVALPYAHVIMEETGWSATLLIMAATASLMAPLAFALGRGSNAAPHPSGRSAQRLSSALAEALKYPSFLLLTAGFFVCGFHIAAVAIHLPAFLADKGFSPSLGAIALTVIGGANIFGSYACGRIGDAAPKRLALVFLYLARGAVFLALIYLPLTETSVLIYAALLGLLWLGTIPLTSGLIVTFFGPRWLSTLYGVVFLSHQAGSFMGAWLGGWLYDAYKSYDMLWWMAAGASVVAAALHLPIREQPAPRLAGAPAE